MGDLGVDTAVDVAAGQFRAFISKDWAVWTPNGGYVSAIALRAAAHDAGSYLPATINVHLVAPADYREVALERVILKESRRARCVRVTMRQDDQLILEALAWLVAPAEGLVHDFAPRPAVPRPSQLRSIEELTALYPKNEDWVPFPFWGNLEQRPLSWMTPEEWQVREPGDPRFEGWFRFRPHPQIDDPVVDACRSVVLADVMCWPAACRAHGEDNKFMGPNADLSVRFLRFAPDNEWLFGRGWSPVAEDGLVCGDAHIWAEDGRLLATGQQTMVCRPMPA